MSLCHARRTPHFFGTDLQGGRFDLCRDQSRYLSLPDLQRPSSGLNLHLTSIIWRI